MKRTLGRLTSDFDSDLDDWHFLNPHHPQAQAVDAVFGPMASAKLSASFGTGPLAGVGKGAEQWCNPPGAVQWGTSRAARTGAGVLLLHDQFRGLASSGR